MRKAQRKIVKWWLKSRCALLPLSWLSSQYIEAFGVGLCVRAFPERKEKMCNWKEEEKACIYKTNTQRLST